MFKIAMIALTVAASSAWANPFDKLGLKDRICYGWSYSLDHMAANPQQSVKTFATRFYRMKNTGDTIYLAIDVDLQRLNKKKKISYKRFHSGMHCTLSSAEAALECRIECDGGRAKVKWDVASLDHQSITFENEGFVLGGTCGDGRGEFLRLEPTVGGDDVFKLERMSDADCAKVKGN